MVVTPRWIGRRLIAWVLAGATLLAMVGCGEDRKSSAKSRDQSGDEQSSQPGAGTAGFPIRQAGVVTHPSGARVSFPAGATIVDAPPVLEGTKHPADMGQAEQIGPVFRYDAMCGLGEGTSATIDLPAAEEDRDATVVVRSEIGLWLPLPSEAITLPNGHPGLRVTVDQQPGPWTFAVVAGGGGPAALDDEDSLLQMLRLRWQDKTAFDQILSNQLAAGIDECQFRWQIEDADHGPGAPGGRMFVIATRGETAWLTELEGALRRLWQVGALVRAGNLAKAREIWMEGLERLDRLSRNEAALESRIVVVPELAWWPKGLPRSVQARRILTHLSQEYAPWGLQWTAWMARQGMLHDLDLRVLPGCGDLLFCDVAILGPKDGGRFRFAGPWVDAAGVHDHRLQPDKTTRHVWLRVISPRMLHRSWTDRLGEAARSAEVGLRVGAVLFGLATWGTGGPAAAFVVPLVFAALDTGLDFIDDGEGTVCVDLGYVSTGASYTVTAITAWKQTGTIAGSGKLAALAKDVGMRLAILDFAAKLVQYATAREGYSRYVRDLAETGPPGYSYGFQGLRVTVDARIPPIIAYLTSYGPVREGQVIPTGVRKGHAIGSADYPVEEMIASSWVLDAHKLYPTSIHGQASLPSAPAELGKFFSRPAKESLPGFRIHLGVREQFIAFSMPKAALQEACRNAGHPAEKWWRVDPNLIGLRVELHPSGSEGVTYRAALRESQERGGDARHFVLHLVGSGHEPSNPSLVDANVAPAFRNGEPIGAYLPGRNVVLLDSPCATLYTLNVKDRQSAGMEYEVDFRNKEWSRRLAARETPREKEAIPWHVCAARVRGTGSSSKAGRIEVVMPQTDKHANAYGGEGMPMKVLVHGLGERMPLRVDFEDGRSYFHWPDRTSVGGEEPLNYFESIPTRLGETTVTFSLPDSPATEPVRFGAEVRCDEDRAAEAKRIRANVEESLANYRKYLAAAKTEERRVQYRIEIADEMLELARAEKYACRWSESWEMLNRCQDYLQTVGVAHDKPSRTSTPLENRAGKVYRGILSTRRELSYQLDRPEPLESSTLERIRLMWGDRGDASVKHHFGVANEYLELGRQLAQLTGTPERFVKYAQKGLVVHPDWATEAGRRKQRWVMVRARMGFAMEGDPLMKPLPPPGWEPGLE